MENRSDGCLPFAAGGSGRLSYKSRAALNLGWSYLFSRAADGTGAAERVGTPGGAAFGWAADGRLVTGTPGRSDIGVVERDGERRMLVASTNFSESAPAMSPDGRWMAYESDESGQSEIYVRPYPDVEKGKWLISSGGGIRPRWSPTGTEVNRDVVLKVLLPVRRIMTHDYAC